MDGLILLVFCVGCLILYGLAAGCECARAPLRGTLADLGCEAVFTAIFSFSYFGGWSSGIQTVLSAISGGLFRTVAQGGDLMRFVSLTTPYKRKLLESSLATK